MKLVFAAPESFLPSLLTALAAQVSRLHFFMKLVFAAPARGWPFFPIALDSQVPGCAAAEPSAKADSRMARKKRFMFVSLVTFRPAAASKAHRRRSAGTDGAPIIIPL